MFTKEQEVIEINNIKAELKELHFQHGIEYNKLANQISKEIKYLLDEKVEIRVSTIRFHSIWFNIYLLLDNGETSGRYVINCKWEDDCRFFSKKESNEEPLLKFNICASGDFDRTSKDQIRFIQLLSTLTNFFKVIEYNLLNLDLTKIMEIENKIDELHYKENQIKQYYRQLELQRIEDKLKPGVKIRNINQKHCFYTINKITPKRVYVDVRNSNMPSIVLEVIHFKKDKILIKLKDGRFEFKED